MSSSTTPTKSNKTHDVTSPSAKRALDFDFWSERKAKMPKILEEDLRDVIAEDLREVKIMDLTVTRRSDVKMLLRCSALYKFPSVLKLACDDGTNKVTVSAFGKSAEKFSFVKLNDVFELTHFEVRLGKAEFTSGSFGNLEIVASDESKVVPVVDKNLPSFPFEWTSLSEIKNAAEPVVVDVLAVIAKNWGKVPTSTGRNKLDVSLTDKSKETIRFTLWDSDADQLVGKEGTVVAIGRASVSSFQGTKIIGTKWHTHLTVNPEMPEAKELLDWFEDEIKQ